MIAMVTNKAFFRLHQAPAFFPQRTLYGFVRGPVLQRDDPKSFNKIRSSIAVGRCIIVTRISSPKLPRGNRSRFSCLFARACSLWGRSASAQAETLIDSAHEISCRDLIAHRFRQLRSQTVKRRRSDRLAIAAKT